VYTAWHFFSRDVRLVAMVVRSILSLGDIPCPGRIHEFHRMTPDSSERWGND